MEEKKMLRLTISRWDPEKDKAPRLETHLVPRDEGMTILDALFHVYENIDRSLAFNFGCRYGRCGICAVNVNGQPTLICQTLALPEMVIEPLPNYPVVRDLVIERAEFGDRTAALHPFLERKSQPAQEGMMPEVLNPKDFDTFVEATRCVDCFSCNSICPVITETQESNRGPNLMMQMAPYLFDPRDSGKRTEILDQLAKQCLLCGTCAETCPKELPIDEIIAKARAEVVAKKGLPFSKRFALRTLLQSPRLISLLLKGGSLVRGLFFKRVSGESGLQIRFPIGKMDSRRVLPDLAKKFFLDGAPKAAPAAQEQKKAAFFVGCSINYLFPQIGEATLRVLNRRGVTVQIPEGQKCCGLPAYGSGDLESARKLALANIAAFEKAGGERVLVTCGSCGAHLKEHYPKLFADAEAVVRERVARFSASVTDLTAYLAEQTGEAAPLPEGKRLRVTYHDSCHMKRKLGVTEEPRQLLRAVSDFVENDKADRCCGLAGSFGLENYELSAKILDRKMESIKKTGAEVIVTGCMGCLMQMQQGVHNHDLKMKTRHIIEVLDESDRAAEEFKTKQK
jgi:glycolate oxidase iron-sulfur subunit